MYNISQTISRNLFNTSSLAAYIEPIAQLFTPNYNSDTPPSIVTRVFSENKNCYTLEIKPHKSWPGFKAGQFIKLSVVNNGALLSRFFSISSSPSSFENQGTIQLTIRIKEDGKMTPWLIKHLQKGDAVYISEAQGDFICQETNTAKLFIAGGSGITPIISILKQYKNTSWMKDAHLLFYVSTPSDRLFNQALDELSQQGLSYEYIFTSQDGRFCFDHIKNRVKGFTKREVYICGPEGLTDAVEHELIKNNTPKEQIFHELFSPRTQRPAFSKEVKGATDNDEIYVEYQQSDKRYHVKIKDTNQTLLDLAESEGLKPLSGCRIGICHQCICKKKSGRVYNTKTQQVSDSGEEEIQLCLSLPIEDVSLNIE